MSIMQPSDVSSMHREPIRLGISACLPGERVRFDGGHKRDPRLRENFIERVFAYRRLANLFTARWSMGDVVRFNTIHKLTLMAHRPESYQRLGRLVASGKSMDRHAFQERYASEFMAAFTVIATPRRQANVLHHMLGYFKQTLDRDSRAELLGLIEDHAVERVPLVVPLTLFGHHIGGAVCPIWRIRCICGHTRSS